MLTFENVIFEAPDVRQQLIAKVAVVSASWTGGVSLTSGHQGVPHGQVLAHRSVLMEAVGGCGGCVGGWSADNDSKKTIAEYQITGPQEHVATALGKLCTSLSSNIAIPVVTGYLDTHYNARKVYVEDQILRCSWRNIVHLLNKSETGDPLLDNRNGSEVSLVSSVPKDPPVLASPLWHHILCCSQKKVLLWNETE
ncbi:hypothetical protein O3P69_016200, partial [Scylla paramamosain]